MASEPRAKGQGPRDQGPGTRDQGQGPRAKGQGTRDQGPGPEPGTREWGFKEELGVVGGTQLQTRLQPLDRNTATRQASKPSRDPKAEAKL